MYKYQNKFLFTKFQISPMLARCFSGKHVSIQRMNPNIDMLLIWSKVQNFIPLKFRMDEKVNLKMNNVNKIRRKY